MTQDDATLRARYDQIAREEDERGTACDFHLRDLEIELGKEYIRDGDHVLDVGCGFGVALREYGTSRRIRAAGIDYSERMIEAAQRTLEQTAPELEVELCAASVTDLPYDDETFDVVTSHRCLMALLVWERQQQALREIHRVLKPGGTLVLMEGTFEGVDRLNEFRRRFGLPEIDPSSRDRLFTLKFHEQQLLEFVEPLYELLRIQRFSMYYFLTRIVQPLLVAPEAPRYDHPLNDVARRVARSVPEFGEIGHLAGFVLRKWP